jgi:hypothetical protein
MKKEQCDHSYSEKGDSKVKNKNKMTKNRKKKENIIKKKKM